MNPRDIQLPLQDLFVHFLNKSQEAKYSLKHLLNVSSAIDDLRKKQHPSETSEVLKIQDLAIKTSGF